MLCIPITAATNLEMTGLLRRAAGEPADIHELRLDALAEPAEVETLVRASTRPVIATCRSRREGGGFDGSDDERRAILLRAAAAGVAYLDAEAGDLPYLANRGSAVLIVSIHDFDTTPDDLVSRVVEMSRLPADWVKFAVAARGPADNVRVFEAIAACPKPCIGIAMGEMGLPSRVLGPAMGSMVTFGSLGGGLESAPGQPTARELAEVYRVGMLSRKTKVYGLLGNPVSQSTGYRLHNRGFAVAGVDAVYIPFLAPDAGEFFAAMPGAINLHGLSVTIPHKHHALDWAAVASEAARRIGAANTLTLRADGWHADNTDCLAILESLREAASEAGLHLDGAPALVIGSGGTARAAGTALMLAGCRVTIAARNADKAAAVAARLGVDCLEWGAAVRREWLVVANTTPVGMVPATDETPFPSDGWRPGMLAFDAVYNPAETRFLREAAAAGAVTVGGGDMFLRQAAGQFRLWTGLQAIHNSQFTIHNAQ